MSRLLKRFGGAMLVGLLMILATPAQRASAQPGISVSFQTFYDQLSPHGQWIDDPTHGYVWTPRGVGRDFRPYYSGGRWAMTSYGNTWVSDYAWGWAPFHYGRWTYDPFYGWMWVPGTTWGPAWVSWRGGGEYYGWAPMGPGININISIGPRYSPPMDWWTFVPCNRLYHGGGYGRYWRGAQYNNTYINNTTIINNTYINNNNTYVVGPRRDEYQRRTGQRVQMYDVRNDNKPGRSSIRGNSVNLYRPTVREERNAKYRPSNAIRAERAIGSNDNRGRGNDQLRTTDQGRNGRVAEAQRGGAEANRQIQMNDRNNRMREVQQPREAQAQTERNTRMREMQQQREAQAQNERNNRMREAQQQRQGEQRNRYQAQADRQQQEVRRAQQQRAVEQRAQQQQQIERSRQQRWENNQPQQRSMNRGGAQRMERSQPQARPQNNERRSGGAENRGRR